MKKLLLIIFLSLGIVSNIFAEYLKSDHTFSLLRQAPADETYFGGDDTRNIYDPYNDEIHPVGEGKKKYNSAYAWGVTEVGEEIWFGSLNTGWCGWMSIHLRLPMVESAFNFANDRQICGLLEGKATQLFIYNTSTNTLKAINPDGQNLDGQILDFQIAPNGEYFGDLYSKFKGLNVRAAGNHNGVVFFGALEFQTVGTSRLDFIRLIAFNAETKRFLGSKLFKYDTIRRLNVVTHPDGSTALYTFLGPDISTQQLGKSKSVMLRWVGPKEDPFTSGDDFDGDGEGDGFVIVGEFDVTEGAGGEFVQTENRVIVSTWAGTTQSIAENAPAGSTLKPSAGALFITSEMPNAGFTKTNKATFIKIFDNDEFEPDPLVAKGYEMGAMTIVDKYLYWGTMHVGTSAGYKHYLSVYPNINECSSPPRMDALGLPLCDTNLTQDIEFADDVLFNTWRAAMLFRTDLSKINDLNDANISTLGDSSNTELLYGEDTMKILTSIPTWNNTTKKYEGATWEMKPNLKGMKAKHGKMGFGNLMNIYTWTMRAANNKVYIGTFDLTGGMGDYFNNDFTDNVSISNPNTNPMLPAVVVKDLSNYEDIKTAKGWKTEAIMKKLYDWSKGDNVTYNAIVDVSSADYSGNFQHGADLFVIDDHSATGGKLKIVTINGFNNEGNNGIRNSAVIGDKLIFGTSTYSALDDDKTGTKGGYEYFRVVDPSAVVPAKESDSGGCSIGDSTDSGMISILLLLFIAILINISRSIINRRRCSKGGN